jgi:thioester reductase-like protein
MGSSSIDIFSLSCSLADGLGTELIARLADQQHPKGPHTISSIDASTIQTRGTATTTDMRRRAARRITEAITSTINSRNQEK